MENKFKTILARHTQGTASEQEEQVIDSFVEKMREDPISLEEIQANTTLKTSMHQGILARTSKRKRSKRSPIKTLVLSFIVLFATVTTAYYYKVYQTTTTYTATDRIQTITLADQSTIALQPGASLRIANDFNTTHRHIQFEGKAFFDIQKNPQLPFTISSNHVTTSVLGTSFWITEEEDYTAIEVETGTVKVEDPTRQDYVILLPKESARYEQLKLQKYNASLDLVSSWSVSLQMENASFTHWKTNIEREFNVVILSQNPRIQSIKITGDYRNTNLEDILDSFCFINNLHYQNQNNLITINEVKTHD